MVHGGSPIADPTRTRKSLVSHYFGLSDCRALGVECVPAGDAYWVRRAHPPLPGERTPRQRVAGVLRRLGLYGLVKRLVGRRAA